MDASENSLRQTIMELSYLSNADGSSLLTQGSTSVIASVSGPDQVNAQKELIDRAYLDVHYESKKGLQSCKDRDVESIISSICQELVMTNLHPRTSLMINVQEVHDDGGLLACAINAVIMALVDSGVPMKCLAAAVNCCVDKTGSIFIDPNAERLEASVFSMTLVLESHTDKILALETHGILDPNFLEQCTIKLTMACKETIDILKKSLRKKFID